MYLIHYNGVMYKTQNDFVQEVLSKLDLTERQYGLARRRFFKKVRDRTEFHLTDEFMAHLKEPPISSIEAGKRGRAALNFDNTIKRKR